MDYAGAELEIDFQERWGIDLHDFFRGRYPWEKFIRFVDALPTASHYRNKVLKDREIAEQILDMEAQNETYQLPDDGEVDLPFVDETPTYQALRVVTDLLRTLIYLTAANSKASPPEPAPRPETAVEQLRFERANATLDDVLMALTGQAWKGD